MLEGRRVARKGLLGGTKKLKKLKSSLYSPYYAEACTELRGPSPRLSAWATQFRRIVATVASRWRHCVDLTGPGIEPQTSRTDSVRLATEPTAGIVKEAIRAKKVAYKAWLANKSSLELRSQYSGARKATATKVKLCKERAWKEFGERLDDDFKTANKVFWQTIRRLRGKRSRAALFIEDSNGVTLKDQDAILNRWRDYFSDLLNPVDATPIQIHEEQVGEDIQITEADVNAVIKSLKTGKAPGEDDIRPEMLKAMNIYGVRWLTRVCKVACSTGQAPKQWQTSVIIPIHKKGDKRKCTNYRGISLISVPGKVYAKCLEKKCREIVEPLPTDAQCGFRPGRSTMNQIFA